jgi:hypothetical protein
MGGYPAGTILLAGNSIPADLSKTQLDLYASTDNGVTWKFVSHIANGGKAVRCLHRHEISIDKSGAEQWRDTRVGAFPHAVQQSASMLLF